jgi:hypothetical protein
MPLCFHTFTLSFSNFFFHPHQTCLDSISIPDFSKFFHSFIRSHRILSISNPHFATLLSVNRLPVSHSSSFLLISLLPLHFPHLRCGRSRIFIESRRLRIHDEMQSSEIENSNSV